MKIEKAQVYSKVSQFQPFSKFRPKSRSKGHENQYFEPISTIFNITTQMLVKGSRKSSNIPQSYRISTYYTTKTSE